MTTQDDRAGFKEWYDAVWLGDEECGQYIPTVGDITYPQYIEGYTLAHGAWQAANERQLKPVMADDAIRRSDALEERDRLGYAVVNVIGKLDEIIEHVEEIELHDFTHIAVSAELWHELEAALEDMPNRAKQGNTIPAISNEVEAELAWVVVTYENSNIKYRTMDSAGIDWTNDPNEAIRFSRRDDAEMFAAGDEFSDLRIEQHKWG